MREGSMKSSLVFFSYFKFQIFYRDKCTPNNISPEESTYGYILPTAQYLCVENIQHQKTLSYKIFDAFQMQSDGEVMLQREINGTYLFESTAKLWVFYFLIFLITTCLLSFIKHLYKSIHNHTQSVIALAGKTHTKHVQHDSPSPRKLCKRIFFLKLRASCIIAKL